MTETNPTFCDECNQVVRLERVGPYGHLTLKCACGESRSVKVKQALPEGWQE